ncbi:MAG TPA: hypothetical protein DD379_09630 [Cyanobacteria bacterium UBA11162]|nr:hypothetical protein [Cyanobacteria bacterium UBA11162]
MVKILIYLFLVALVTVTQAPVANCQQVNVEVETGPEFSSGDADTVWGCIQSHYHQRFPFDFIYEVPELRDTQCPSATFWGKTREFCWLLDIFHQIEPAILIGMLVFGIMVL